MKLSSQENEVLNAIKQLEGKILSGHTEIYNLCNTEIITSKRRVKSPLDKLIEKGAVKGGITIVDGLRKQSYTCV